VLVPSEYYGPRAFLCNEYCSSAFVSLLFEVNGLTFELARTDVDLDNSWTARVYALARRRIDGRTGGGGGGGGGALIAPEGAGVVVPRNSRSRRDSDAARAPLSPVSSANRSGSAVTLGSLERPAPESPSHARAELKWAEERAALEVRTQRSVRSAGHGPPSNGTGESRRLCVRRPLFVRCRTGAAGGPATPAAGGDGPPRGSGEGVGAGSAGAHRAAGPAAGGVGAVVLMRGWGRTAETTHRGGRRVRCRHAWHLSQAPSSSSSAGTPVVRSPATAAEDQLSQLLAELDLAKARHATTLSTELLQQRLYYENLMELQRTGADGPSRRDRSGPSAAAQANDVRRAAPLFFTH